MKTLAKLSAGMLIGGLMGISSPLARADILPCSQTLKNNLLQSSAGDFARITRGNCRLDFTSYDILKPLKIIGARASGLRINCNGAKIARKAGSTLTTVLSIQSSYNAEYVEEQMLDLYETSPSAATPPYGVSRPENIEVNGCVVVGAIDVLGMGGNPAVISSRSQLDTLNDEHTLRMQAMAPTNIRLNGLQVYADPSLGLRDLVHIYPGVTNTALTNSVLTGEISDVTVYLSPESEGNLIQHNVFDVAPHNGRKREIISVDASSSNDISDNVFKNIQQGAIHLYRNCGESGLTRHQPPSGNQIFHNDFFYTESTAEAVWLNKRAVAPVIVNPNDWPTRLKTYCKADEALLTVKLSSGADFTLNRSKNLLGSGADTYKLPLEAYNFKLTDLLVNHDAGSGNQIYANYFLNYGQYGLIHDGVPVPDMYRRIDKFKNAVKYTGSDYIDAAIKFSGLNVEAENTQIDNHILAYPQAECNPDPAPFVFNGVTRQVVYDASSNQCYIMPLAGN